MVRQAQHTPQRARGGSLSTPGDDDHDDEHDHDDHVKTHHDEDDEEGEDDDDDNDDDDDDTEKASKAQPRHGGWMSPRPWAAPGAHPEAPQKPFEALRGPP